MVIRKYETYALTEKCAQELALWALSDNFLEASIGMAAINSLLEIDEQSLREINASEVIGRECKQKNLVVVGHFPFVEKNHRQKLLGNRKKTIW